MINLSKIGASDNAVALVDTRYPGIRWLDAWGNVDKYILNVYNTGEWTTTATGTAPVANSVLPDAKILISTQASTDFSGDNMQVLGTKFKLEAGKPLYFGAKITCSEATQSDLVVGLCGTDTTLTAASSSHALAVGAGGAFFSKIDAVTSIYFKTYTTGTEANSAVAGTLDTSAHWYEMYWDGYKLTGYFDGASIGCFGSGVTTEVLTPSICFRKGDTAAGVYTCTIHEFITIAVRG